MKTINFPSGVSCISGLLLFVNSTLNDKRKTICKMSTYGNNPICFCNKYNNLSIAQEDAALFKAQNDTALLSLI